MRTLTSVDTSKISAPAARFTIGAAMTVPLLLASLHALSPEFAPTWRMVSDYANGHYAWMLSLMFVIWGTSMLAAAYTVRQQLATKASKFGLGLLYAAGVATLGAAVFDINHPLHNLMGLVGTLGFSIAALLISVRLSRTHEWAAARKPLLWLANASWVAYVLMMASLVALIVTYMQSGAPTTGTITELPEGVIGVVGIPNRLLVLVNCLWLIVLAHLAIKLSERRT